VGEPPVGADRSDGPVGHGSASARLQGGLIFGFLMGFVGFFLNVQISVLFMGNFLVLRAEWVSGNGKQKKNCWVGLKMKF
jgi:hypothetical protein